MKSDAITDTEKDLIVAKLASRITSENSLILQCDEDRSQLRNKEIVTRRFVEMISSALVVPKTRKATKVPRSVIEKRIKQKRSQSEIKQSRQKPKF